MLFRSHMAGCDDITGGVGSIAMGVLLLYLWKKDGRATELAARLPVTPAAQVQEGMVQVVGRAAGEPAVSAYLSGRPCFVSHCKLEYLPDHQSDPEWTTEMEEKQAAPFYLEDDSGRVLVDPEKAEFQFPGGGEWLTSKKPSSRAQAPGTVNMESRMRDVDRKSTRLNSSHT